MPNPDVLFIGRDREQTIFRQTLGDVLNRTGQEGSGYLLLVSGHGGIGKSTLLERFYAISKGQSADDSRFHGRFLTVLVNWESPECGLRISDTIGPSADGLMASLARSITTAAGGRRRQRRIGKAFADYYRARILEKKTRTQSALPRLAGGAVNTALSLAGIPGGQPAGELLTSTFGTIAEAFDTRRQTRDLARETDHLGGPVQDAFIAGLGRVADIQPVVVILDTCEILGRAAETLRSLIQASSTGLCWVVGIRLEQRNNAAWDSETVRYLEAVDPRRCHVMELDGFGASDIRSYVSASITKTLSTDDITRVRDLTGGTPLAIALVTRMIEKGVTIGDLVSETSPSNDAATIVRELAERYLRHVSRLPDLAADLPLLLGLALLSDAVDDYGLLAALWGVPERRIHSLLRELARRHDFVFSGQIGSPKAVMHREIRDTVRKLLREPDQRVSVREMNKRAIVFLSAQLQASMLQHIERQLSPDDQDQHSQAWQANAIALLWHTFWADTAQGVALIRHLYPPAALLAAEFARAQSQVARFQLGSADLRARRLLEVLAQGPAAGSDGDNLVKALDDLDTDPIADGPYASDISHSVYYTLLRLAWWPASPQWLDLPNQMSRLSWVSQELAASHELQADAAQRTCALIADEANRLGIIASTHRQYEIAIAAFTITANWRPRDSQAHGNVALANAALGRAGQAAEAFKTAIRAEPDNASLHAAFGELMMLAKSGDIQGRREALDWAIRSSAKAQLHPMVLRGLIPQAAASGEAESEARDYFTKALTAESHRQDFQAYELRAIAYSGLGLIETAVEEFEQGSPRWTAADKYRSAIYELLKTRSEAAAEALMEKWQRLIREHPDAAFPWG